MANQAHRVKKTKETGWGHLIKKNFVTLPVALTVGEALGRIRTQAKRGDIFYLYVVDDGSRLVGIVSIRNLLLSGDAEPLAHLLSRNVECLPEDFTRAEAAQRFADCRFLSLPVVSADGKIIGVVHAHDLSGQTPSSETLFEERTRGALFELLGIEAEGSATSSFSAAKGRFPWLLVNMIGGTLSALFIHGIGPSIPNAVVFLAFVPILLIICESVGMQTVSVVITKLRHSTSQAGKVGWREIKIAGWLGFASAVIVGLAIRIFLGAPDVALAVGIAMLVATLWVSSVAFFVPLLTRKLGIDPSISAGPVVLAVADCTALLLYLLIAYQTAKLLIH